MTCAIAICDSYANVVPCGFMLCVGHHFNICRKGCLSEDSAEHRRIDEELGDRRARVTLPEMI